MKIVNCRQGTPEWRAARLGLPTASNFDRIITRAGKPSKASDKYLAELIVEWYTGYPAEEDQSRFMERGSELEAVAVRDYEFQHDVDTQTVGLCLLDDGRAGASPDRLVGEDGLLEFKCPAAATQVMYLLDGPPDDYFVQVQGQLWVTGRKWCDLYLWHPTFPRVSRRYEPDPVFITAMAEAVAGFCDRLDEAKAKLAGDKAEHDARVLAMEQEAQAAF